MTPKWSGQHRRYRRQSVSILWGTVALLAVLLILIAMYLGMPPLG